MKVPQFFFSFRDTFVAYDGDFLYTFLVNPDDSEGISVTNLGKTRVPTGETKEKRDMTQANLKLLNLNHLSSLESISF